METVTYTDIVNKTNSLYKINAFNVAAALTKHFNINFISPYIKIPEIIFPNSDSYYTMLASEKSLSKNWDNSVEDSAWAHL